MQVDQQTGCPVPVPGTRSQKNVQRGAAPDLREEPEKGPRCVAEPDAARLHEEPVASRRPPGVYSDSEFRRLCKLVRDEVRTHAGLDGTDLMEQLKCVCADRQLRYDSAVLGRVLDVVQPRKRLVQRQAEPPRVHWRDRCRHTPTCTTPTQCELKDARESR